MSDEAWQNVITESQRLCLRLVGEGMSSKEIALQTGLSPRTVDQYVNRAALALGASNRREAARKLALLDADPLNKLQLKPERVAGAQNSGSLPGIEPGAETREKSWKYFSWIPPLGGARHDLTPSERIRETVKAAVIAIIGFASVVSAGAWLQSLFT